MLTIRLDQISALLSAQFDQADREIIAYARRRFPEVCADMSDEHLKALVERMRSLAASFRLDFENQVATFVDLAIMYGEDFVDQEWAARFLNQSNEPAAARLAALIRAVRASGNSI